MASDTATRGKALKKWPLLVAGLIAIGLLVAAGLLLMDRGGPRKPKAYVIGIINPSPNQESTVTGFKEGMAELGYVEGKTLTYIYNGAVSADRLDAEAQSLAKAKVDLILSITTSATKAAQRAAAGTDIAVVFIPVTDPVAAGIVASLTRPGGNTTGVTSVIQEGKRLEWLLRVAPKTKRILIAYNPKDPSPVASLKAVGETAAQLGVELVARQIGSAEEASAIYASVPKGIDAVFYLPDAMANAHPVEMYALVTAQRLPTSGPNMKTVNDGALTAYGIDLAVAAKRQAARLADSIIRGAKPADLPVETTQLFSAINLKTAQAIGLDIPDDILRQANVIVR